MRDSNAATCAAPAGEETYLLKTNTIMANTYVIKRDRVCAALPD